MNKKALVVGSVAFDLIFDIHGKIQDEIMLDGGKLGRQNMMFTAKNRKHYFGGTGGNIAYGLGVLGENPLLFSMAGMDFEGEFKKHFQSVGVNEKVYIDKKGFTAVFYGMSDEEEQQIGVYQPNAYGKIDSVPLAKTIKEKDFKNVVVAIFSAGTGKSILRHMKESRLKLGRQAVCIFDPGQVISVFYDRKLLEETLSLSDIFIGNEIEFKQLEQILGYSKKDLLNKGVTALVKTLGEKGSVVYEKDKEIFIPAVKVSKVAETTGAGDAYRAGMIYGLLQGLALKEACGVGAKLSAKCVEFFGAQTYKLKSAELKKLLIKH